MPISTKTVTGQSFLFGLFGAAVQEALQELKKEKKEPISAKDKATGDKERTTLPDYIRVCGTKKEKENLTRVLVKIPYTGEEATDRLKIQVKLDEEGCKHGPLYQGNTVYPSTKLVKEFQQMKKSGSLKKLSKEMYEFLHLNFDIAHYSRQGYIEYYNASFQKLWDETLQREVARVPCWKTDVQEILKKAELV